MGPAELFASAAISAAAALQISAALDSRSAPQANTAPPALAERFAYQAACPQAEGAPCVVDLQDQRQLVD